jgi:hypothetical protein
MSKIHMVACDDGLKFMNLINNFIADKQVIDIKYQSHVYHTEYRNGVPSNVLVNDRAMIIYEE